MSDDVPIVWVEFETGTVGWITYRDDDDTVATALLDPATTVLGCSDCGVFHPQIYGIRQAKLPRCSECNLPLEKVADTGADSMSKSILEFFHD